MYSYFTFNYDIYSYLLSPLKELQRNNQEFHQVVATNMIKAVKTLQGRNAGQAKRLILLIFQNLESENEGEWVGPTQKSYFFSTPSV